VLWTHNDSGDSARLFLISQTGDTKAVVTLNGATARDWEDMAVAGSGTLPGYMSATSATTLLRTIASPSIVFREPHLMVAATAAAQTLAVDCEQMTLRYPDGPRDAESLMATADGQLFIVSKSLGGSAVIGRPARLPPALLKRCKWWDA
jgi:hypothetical protein